MDLSLFLVANRCINLVSQIQEKQPDIDVPHTWKISTGSVSRMKLAESIQDFAKHFILSILQSYRASITSQLLLFLRLVPNFEADIKNINDIFKKKIDKAIRFCIDNDGGWFLEHTQRCHNEEA